jgi:Leucine-rich repeat (LRR) protein
MERCKREYDNYDIVDNIIPDDCDIYNCYNVGLTELPKLPNKLEELYCRNNSIGELPELPPGLIILHCTKNLLTRLPELPSKLTQLYCGWNYITELPELNNVMYIIHIYYNPIKFITPRNYNIMKQLYIISDSKKKDTDPYDNFNLNFNDTIIYDNSGFANYAQFFGIE